MYVCVRRNFGPSLCRPLAANKVRRRRESLSGWLGENDQEMETVFEEYSDDELQPSPGPWTPSHNYTWEALPVGAGGRTVWIPRPNVVIVSRLAYRDRFAAKVAFARHSVLSPARIENITAFLLW